MTQDDIKQTSMLFYIVAQANAEIVFKIDHDRLLCSPSLQIIVPFDITSCSKKKYLLHNTRNDAKKLSVTCDI